MTVDELIAQVRANIALPRETTIEGIERQLRNVLASLLLGNDYDADADKPIGYLCRHLATILAQIEDWPRQPQH